MNEWRSEVKGWDWIASGKEFIWFSEKDGWRHLYRINRDGKETKITNGDYDVIDLLNVDEKNGYVYFYASPVNATQKFLYKTRLDGSGKAERVSPLGEEGTHQYEISPNGKFARHSFSNYYTRPLNEWVILPDHKPFQAGRRYQQENKTGRQGEKQYDFFPGYNRRRGYNGWMGYKTKEF